MRRGRWTWAAQLGLAGLVAWFVWRAISRDLADFRAVGLSLDLNPGPIAGAAAIVLLTYGLLILAWRSVLGGWKQQLAFRAALRIWCLSNLGRYLPGKVWSVAGLALMAQREGVQGWAAAGAALVMQALSVGTGAAVAFALLPQVASPVALGAAVVIAAMSVAALMTKSVLQRVTRIAGGRVELDILPARAVVGGTLATLAAWMSYGVAFWLLARGVTPAHVPSLGLAVGGFAASYIVGLLAVFAPGGVVVREGVMLGLLTPAIGTGPALALSLGSRLLLTLTEIVAALLALTIRSDQGDRG